MSTFFNYPPKYTHILRRKDTLEAVKYNMLGRPDPVHNQFLPEWKSHFFSGTKLAYSSWYAGLARMKHHFPFVFYRCMWLERCCRCRFRLSDFNLFRPANIWRWVIFEETYSWQCYAFPQGLCASCLFISLIFVLIFVLILVLTFLH